MLHLIRENKNAFYVFDMRTLKDRIGWLRSRLPGGTGLCYAVKANPFVLREIRNDPERFEICSYGEAEICMQSGISSEKMVISGVYKTPETLEKLVADASFRGIFTVESLLQYTQLCTYSERFGHPIRVLLRLTNDSQFGINEEDIVRILRERSLHPYMHYIGLQFFSGTQKTSIKRFHREIVFLDEFLLRLEVETGLRLEELEYGPGFPVDYFDSDHTDEEMLLAEVSSLLNRMVGHPKITLEIGRSMAASCGRYYTHIVDRKENRGQHYALIDGGMHQLVYFGQHMAMKHPHLSVIGKPDVVPEIRWTICGALCSMNDIVAKQVLLPEIEIGDTICFENTGAYCAMEGMALFLSRDLPEIYLIRENGDIVCARKHFETRILNTPDYETED
ncbi:alanine racemase [[Clostridium] aminophilum]|uniref:diaminopimelate decarboxylase family protein n=1 Tax=[Clostridium] aminophilum TaxID=1526 RepID=UPI003323CF1F